MAKVCELCGKGPMAGNRIIRHGLQKSKGGIGLHTTGVTRRRFLPNLQRVRIQAGKTVRTVQICMSCLKKEKVAKAK